LRASVTALCLFCAALAGLAAASHAEAPRAAGMAEDCASRSAAVQPLAKILNTRDASFDCLGLSVDARAEITGIRFEKHAAGAGLRPAPALADVREFAPAEVASARGAVLDGTPGHDAVLLHGEIDTGRATVPLTVTFLHNGLTGEYRACAASLDRGADGAWHLSDARHRRIAQVVVETWRLPVIGVVGIDQLRGLCTPS